MEFVWQVVSIKMDENRQSCCLGISDTAGALVMCVFDQMMSILLIFWCRISPSSHVHQVKKNNVKIILEVNLCEWGFLQSKLCCWLWIEWSWLTVVQAEAETEVEWGTLRNSNASASDVPLMFGAFILWKAMQYIFFYLGQRIEINLMVTACYSILGSSVISVSMYILWQN